MLSFTLPFQLELLVATSWTQSHPKKKTLSQNQARLTSCAKTEGLRPSLSPRQIPSPHGWESPGSSCTSCSSSSSSTRGSLALCTRTRTGAAKLHCSNLSALVLANDNDQKNQYSRKTPPCSFNTHGVQLHRMSNELTSRVSRSLDPPASSCPTTRGRKTWVAG